METPESNGLAPDQINGHDTQTLGHEASNGLQENNLLMEAVLKGEEQHALTAKMDGPEAGTADTQEEAADKKKKKHDKGRSIANTLTSCDVFIANATTMIGYAVNRPIYELESLKLLRDRGYELVGGVSKTESKWRYAVAYRKDVFGAIEARLSRIRAELILSGASAVTVAQVQSIIRKLRGERKVAKDMSNPNDDYNSVSQRNFDDIVVNFERLVAMLANDPNYDPVIEELKLLALEGDLETMRAANLDAIAARAEWEAARTERNNFFNTDVTGLVDVFMTSKKVVLANYGIKSLNYKRVKGLSYLKIR
ncbi:MAG: hypothetical protein R2797_00500 [Gelidibacter sp.]